MILRVYATGLTKDNIRDSHFRILDEWISSSDRRLQTYTYNFIYIYICIFVYIQAMQMYSPWYMWACIQVNIILLLFIICQYLVVVNLHKSISSAETLDTKPLLPWCYIWLNLIIFPAPLSFTCCVLQSAIFFHINSNLNLQYWTSTSPTFLCVCVCIYISTVL